MNITLTITGDVISPEVAQMLQALGVALSGQQAPKQVVPEPEAEAPAEIPAEAAAPVKKARKPRKTAEPEPEVAEEPAEEEAPAEVPADEPESEATLESLREKVVFLAKSGKSDAVKKAFEAVGGTKLSDVKKSDFSALDKILSEI
jgi:hypothetical protein